jgi:hypothetical protein
MFSILPQEITITSPIFSDTLISGRKYYLTWRTKGTFSQANLWYSIDGGLEWITIATNITNNGYYEWLLPEVVSKLTQIKIANSGQPEVFARSDTFTISAPILEITSPPLGAVWCATRKYYISWNCLGGISYVNLYYSLNGGSEWSQIVANQQNQGNYEWTISEGTLSEDCRVKLVSWANSEIAYMSDSFVIGIVGIKEESSAGVIPTEFCLQGFLPNPFVRGGDIKLAIPENSKIKLVVYDVCGRIVDNVFEGNAGPGFHTIRFNGKNLANGIYFLRFEAFRENEKVYNRAIKILKI